MHEDNGEFNRFLAFLEDVVKDNPESEKILAWQRGHPETIFKTMNWVKNNPKLTAIFLSLCRGEVADFEIVKTFNNLTQGEHARMAELDSILAEYEGAPKMVADQQGLNNYGKYRKRSKKRKVSKKRQRNNYK